MNVRGCRDFSASVRHWFVLFFVSVQEALWWLCRWNGCKALDSFCLVESFLCFSVSCAESTKHVTSLISWWTSLSAVRTCSRLFTTRLIWFRTTFLLQPGSFLCGSPSLLGLYWTHVWFWPRIPTCSRFGLGFLGTRRVVAQPRPFWGTSVEKITPLRGPLKPSTGGSLSAVRSLWLLEFLLWCLM